MSYGKQQLNSLNRCTNEIDAPQEHTVYILVMLGQSQLFSAGRGKRTFYTGVTTNLKRRLVQHNTGKTRATHGIQWEVFCFIRGFTQKQAYHLERYLKRGDTRTKRALFVDWANSIAAGEHYAQEYWNAVYPSLRLHSMFGEEPRY